MPFRSNSSPLTVLGQSSIFSLTYCNNSHNQRLLFNMFVIDKKKLHHHRNPHWPAIFFTLATLSFWLQNDCFCLIVHIHSRSFAEIWGDLRRPVCAILFIHLTSDFWGITPTYCACAVKFFVAQNISFDLKPRLLVNRCSQVIVKLGIVFIPDFDFNTKNWIEF